MGALNVLPGLSDEGRGKAALPALRDHLALLQRDLAGMAAEVDLVRDRLSRVGRPSVLRRPGVREQWSTVKGDLVAGRLTKARAARALGVSRRSVDRLLAAAGEVA